LPGAPPIAGVSSFPLNTSCHTTAWVFQCLPFLVLKIQVLVLGFLLEILLISVAHRILSCLKALIHLLGFGHPAQCSALDTYNLVTAPVAEILRPCPQPGKVRHPLLPGVRRHNSGPQFRLLPGPHSILIFVTVTPQPLRVNSRTISFRGGCTSVAACCCGWLWQAPFWCRPGPPVSCPGLFRCRSGFS